MTEKPTLLKPTALQVPTIQRYERYLPTAFDDSLTILEKMNKVIHFLSEIGELTNEMLERWNEVYEWVLNVDLQQTILEQLANWKNDGTLAGLINGQLFDELENSLTSLENSVAAHQAEYTQTKTDVTNLIDLVRFVGVGLDSLEAKGSVYLSNDTNLFGKKVNGDHVNIGTVQDNDIVQYGDYGVNVMWFIANNYFSFRSKGDPTVQKIDDNGANVGAGRTILHQGNTGGHAVVFSNGEQTLLKSVSNSLNILTNINGCYPAGSFASGKYTIPRAGMYFYDVAVKLVVAPPRTGYIRFTIKVEKPDGSSSQSDMEDVLYDPAAYGTPFVSGSFQYRHSLGDKVSLLVEPLTDDVTIGTGTKLYLYQLGDTIQS